MASTSVHCALLRPAVLQVLRAAGFTAAKPAVVDTATDMAARYLLLLANSTLQNAFDIHGDNIPTTQDVRLALSENGALFPQLTPSEEARRGWVEEAGELVPFEDLRGVRNFVDWAQGEVNREIRRIAGFSGDELNVDQIAAGTDEKVDYLTALKKHGKADEDTRYQGTLLGKEAESQPVMVAGGQGGLAEWIDKFKAKSQAEAIEQGASPADSDSSMPSSAGASPGADDEQEPESPGEAGAMNMTPKTTNTASQP